MSTADGRSPRPGATRRGVGRGVYVATVVVVAVVVLAAGVYIGKAAYSSTSGSSAPRFLVVGTNIPFPPFEDYNYSAGAYVGFDINFSQLFAKALGRTLVVDNYADFNTLLSDVGVGDIDMAASAITESGIVGATRNETMSFSIPYFVANQALLVQSSSTVSCPSTGCSVAELASLTIGVQVGTSSQSWAQQYLQPNETGNGSVQDYSTVDLETGALESGALDGVIIDGEAATNIAAGSGGSLKVAGSIVTNELYGFAVPRGDPEHILPVINRVITQSMQDGTYAALIREWFG